ncbi:MAG: Ig-like domain-containing protein, partial [Muribaculaceae bacterium]|nr:Ig-like domain-containing protein [Muribaculaceae bacterium]
LPLGMTAEGAALTSSFLSLSNNASGFSLNEATVSGQYRVVLFNMAKTNSIPTVDGQSVFTFQVTADPTMTAGEYVLNTSDFKFVSATSNEGEGYIGTNTSCKVTVNEPLATGITLNWQTLSLVQGTSQTLTATVTPSYASQNVSWSSSNIAVATVNASGKVFAVGEGTTVIVASTTDGSNLNATCIVTVKPVKATGISLDKTQLAMELNETATLTASLEPANTTEKTVSWQSSDTSVATVDQNGMVTATALGNATITATTIDGTNLSATCKVTVGVITVKSVTLDQHEAQVILGNDLQLTASVLPNDAANRTLQWQSSDAQIATVDQNGLVKTVGLGQAVISAQTTDGSNIKDSCVVTVLPELVTSIVLDKSEMEVYVEMTDTIHATVIPAEATIQSLTWTSSNESVATIDTDGVVTAVGVGNATITATATDGSGVTATCRVTVPAADGNYLSAESFTIVRGNEVIVPIAMTNSSKITAMQCELRLTGGIEVAQDEYGDPDIYLSERGTDHELTCTQRQDFMQILAASITSAPFKSNMGTLYYIHLKADQNLEEGTYMMALRNITLSTVDGQRIKPNDVEVTIGIQPYMLGDANGDAHVDVADFLTTANYILYKDPFPFYFRAADVDVNGAVDANDLTGITNIGLGKASGTVNMSAADRPARAPRAAVQSGDKLYIADFDLPAGQTKTVQMMLNNEQTYSGMQCDLTLPAGLTLTKVEKGTRCRNHTLTTNVLDNNSTRLWLSSMSSRTISGTSGELIKVTVKATSDFSGTHQLWLRNIVGAHETNDASGERVELSDNKTSINPGAQLTGDVTGNGVVGIEDVNAIINIMLGKAQASDFPGIADVTGNGTVGIEDVNAIINIMLGSE